MRRLVFLLAFAACGPAAGTTPTADAPLSTGDGPPASGLTPGGGITGGALAGTLRVYVIGAGGSTPIGGASVTAGTQTATTDGGGLATFTNVTAPVSVTASASGRTAATWIGVAGKDVTIPLQPDPRPIPTAHASGTITGWDQLPSPAFGHYTLAVVLYSFDADLSSPANSITQPTASDGTPLDTCVDDGSGGACAWQLTTRTGPQRHLAAIVDGNAHGTTDPSDDTYTLIGYAIGPSMTLAANQTVTGETLTMVPANALTSLSVGFPAGAAGLPHATAIPMLDLGADGKLVFPLPQLTPSATSTKVIAASGEYAGTYTYVGLATPSASATTPYSTTIAKTTTLGAWLPAPTGLSATGGTYKFTTSGGAKPLYATFARADKSIAWDVMILDGSTSFTLPTIPGDPLAQGSFTMTVTAADESGFDPTSFAVPDLPAKLARASGAGVMFTR